MRTCSDTHTQTTLCTQLPSLCHLKTAAHYTQQSCPDWTLPAALQSWDHCHPPYLGTGCARSRPAAQCGQCKCHPIHGKGWGRGGNGKIVRSMEREEEGWKGVTCNGSNGLYHYTAGWSVQDISCYLLAHWSIAYNRLIGNVHHHLHYFTPILEPLTPPHPTPHYCLHRSPNGGGGGGRVGKGGNTKVGIREFPESAICRKG